MSPVLIAVNRIVKLYAEKIASRVPEEESAAITDVQGDAARAAFSVGSCSSTHEETRQPKIEPWAPVICVTRVSCLEDGRPLELVQAVSRAVRYQYRVRLQGRAPIKLALQATRS